MVTQSIHLQSSEILENHSKKTVISRRSWISSFSRSAWTLLALPLLLFISIPVLSLFLRTPWEQFLTTLNQTQVLQAVNLSLVSSSLTTAISLLIGTPVAVLLARRKSRFHNLVDTLVDLPSVLPPSVAGVALLMAFGRRGIFGAVLADAGINIPFTLIAVIMAQTFIASPLFIKTAAVGFSGIDPELIHAASLDGANRLEIFRYVILPLSWSSMLSGSVMTWARSLGEFGATIIFAGNFPGKTQTMPLAIYLGFEINMNVALTLAVIMICLSFFTLILVKGVLHRHLDREF